MSNIWIHIGNESAQIYWEQALNYPNMLTVLLVFFVGSSRLPIFKISCA